MHTHLKQTICDGQGGGLPSTSVTAEKSSSSLLSTQSRHTSSSRESRRTKSVRSAAAAAREHDLACSQGVPVAAEGMEEKPLSAERENGGLGVLGYRVKKEKVLSQEEKVFSQEEKVFSQEHDGADWIYEEVREVVLEMVRALVFWGGEMEENSIEAVGEVVRRQRSVHMALHHHTAEKERAARVPKGVSSLHTESSDLPSDAQGRGKPPLGSSSNNKSSPFVARLAW